MLKTHLDLKEFLDVWYRIADSTLISKMAFARAFHNVYIVTGIICLLRAFVSYLRGEGKTKCSGMLED